MKNCDIRIECPILRFHSVLRENTSIAFVVDRRLRVLLWSNGLVEATNLTQDTVEGQDVSSLPFLSRANRDNTTAAIRQLFNEKGGGSKSTTGKVQFSSTKTRNRRNSQTDTQPNVSSTHPLR